MTVSLWNKLTPLAGGWIVLIVVQWVASSATQRTTNLPVGSGAFAWSVAVDFLAALAITAIATRSTLRGWHLAAAVSAFYFGIHSVNAIEAVAYLGIGWSMAGRVMISGVIAIPAWKWIFAHKPARASGWFPWTKRSPAGWAARLFIGNVGYLVLYLTAGMLVYPFVKEFYSTQSIPGLNKIVLLQFLVRGPVFVGLCLLLVRMLPFSRVRTSILVGVVFATVSGIVPLMVPSPLFPNYVRLVHLCEVVCSNFIFSALVSGLLWLDQRPTTTLAFSRHPERAKGDEPALNWSP